MTISQINVPKPYKKVVDALKEDNGDLELLCSGYQAALRELSKMIGSAQKEIAKLRARQKAMLHAAIQEDKGFFTAPGNRDAFTTRRAAERAFLRDLEKTQ